MKRRDFLKAASATAALQFANGTLHAEQVLPDAIQPAVKTVYVVAKCHLDLGFTDFEDNVIHTYFKTFIPQAIDTARELQQVNGEERYVWTLAAWMVYQYLEQASPSDRKNAEQAIAAGQLAWHAMPFTWQSEMLDRSLLESSFGISKALDKRFGVTTIAGKLTDVPGHTRGIIAPTVAAGVHFLDVGSNLHPPDVPAFPHLFNWRDPSGVQIAVLYHHGYGGTVAIPGTDTAVAINVRDDNSGPHLVSEIKTYYADLHRQFPNATIIATNLNTVAKAILPVSSHFPVVTQEIGDVWIYGAGSNPERVARYRELCRLRLEWLGRGAFQSGDAVDFAFMRRLILVTEHNWGLDTGGLPLPGMLLNRHGVYSPDELAQARASDAVFQKYDACWAEKNADVDRAVRTLPETLRAEAQKRLDALRPIPPKIRAHNGKTDLETEHFTLSLDPKNGAITRLLDRRNHREWASAAHPLALFRYETFDSRQCDRYVRQFATLPADMKLPPDFHDKFLSIMNNIWGKPGLDQYAVEARMWEPELKTVSLEETPEDHRFIAELHIPDAGPAEAKFVAWPRRITTEIVMPKSRPEVQITLWCTDKRANRLPEAMWFSFSPDAPSQTGWQLEKLNQPVSPNDVISYGGRHMHAVTRYVRYSDAHGVFQMETLDAPLIAPGQRLLTDFNNRPPNMLEGFHVNLYNNLWNTAFPQWYGADMRFRFVLSFPQKEKPFDEI